MVSASYVEFLEGRMPLGEFYVLLSFSVLGALDRPPPRATWS